MSEAGSAFEPGMRKIFGQRARSQAPRLGGELQQRIAVTGGSGFIGTNLIDFYLANGAKNLVNWDIHPPRDSSQADHWRPLDLRDAGAVAEEMKLFRADVLFHLGARTDLLGKGDADYGANVDGVENLIHAVRQLPHPPRTIFASSRLVCRIGYQPTSEDDYCPPNAYGASKVQGELTVRRLAGTSFDWLIVRPTSIWGPWFRTPYRDFFDTISRGRYVHPRGRRIRKSFGFVGNTIVQLDRLMFGDRARVRHQTIYLADYPPLQLPEWADEVARCMGKGRVRSVPVPALRILARLGDVATLAGVGSAPLTTFRLNNLLTDMVHDTRLLEEVAGPLPFSLSEGTAITVGWFRGPADRGDVAA